MPWKCPTIGWTLSFFFVFFFARCRVADVPDGGHTVQAVEHVPGEDALDEPVAALAEQAVSVRRNDAGGIGRPMLIMVKTDSGQLCRFASLHDCEQAAHSAYPST
jgi:hypothetical protein